MIELVQNDTDRDTMQARRDFARITGTDLVELPYWFRDTKTDISYHSIFGAIGWPRKISERGDDRKGYAVIIGVAKGNTDPARARFVLLDETEENSVELLLSDAIAMRKRWGFGVHKSLMRVFIGDHRQFEMVVANYNTRMVEAGKEDEALMLSPPDDYESPQAFNIYMRQLQAVLSKRTIPKRLHLGQGSIIAKRITAFQRDDPAVFAIGGLIHTLLLRSPWMEQTVPSVFAVDF